MIVYLLIVTVSYMHIFVKNYINIVSFCEMWRLCDLSESETLPGTLNRYMIKTMTKLVITVKDHWTCTMLVLYLLWSLILTVWIQSAQLKWYHQHTFVSRFELLYFNNTGPTIASLFDIQASKASIIENS